MGYGVFSPKIKIKIEYVFDYTDRVFLVKNIGYTFVQGLNAGSSCTI